MEISSITQNNIKLRTTGFKRNFVDQKDLEKFNHIFKNRTF